MDKPPLLACMHYTIWQVSPPNYSHSRCFDEVSLALRDGIRESGYWAEITTTPPKRSDRVIILGAHLLHPNDILYLTVEDDGRDAGGHLIRDVAPDGLRRPIVWQLEQIPGVGDDRSSLAVTSVYLEVLKRADVWDYSERNIELLARQGIAAKLLPVGYSECLTRIANVEPDIDVLFYGSINPRRQFVLERLKLRGVKVHHAFDCYGVERDALIARSKVILNCHYYDAKVFEIVRCSYLLANRKVVVSETGYGVDYFEGGMYLANYEDLAGCCVDALANWEKSTAIAEKGFEIMSARRQSGFLRGLLGRA